MGIGPDKEHRDYKLIGHGKLVKKVSPTLQVHIPKKWNKLRHLKQSKETSND
jgi:hypothetical protein